MPDTTPSYEPRQTTSLGDRPKQSQTASSAGATDGRASGVVNEGHLYTIYTNTRGRGHRVLVHRTSRSPFAFRTSLFFAVRARLICSLLLPLCRFLLLLLPVRPWSTEATNVPHILFSRPRSAGCAGVLVLQTAVRIYSCCEPGRWVWVELHRVC